MGPNIGPVLFIALGICLKTGLAYVEALGASADTAVMKKFAPEVAFICNKPAMHRVVNGWEPDFTTDCLDDPDQILKYCEKVYPDHKFVNVMEAKNRVEIPEWPKFDGPDRQKTGNHSEKSEKSGGTHVKISELPLYGEPEVKVKFVPEEVGELRKKISYVREGVWDWYDSIQDTRDNIREKYEIGKAHTQSTIDMIQNDEGVLPRLAVIGLAGLSGVVLGYRGGVVRKVAFSSFAVTAATALCYPNQAVDITSRQYEKLRDKIKDMRAGGGSE